MQTESPQAQAASIETTNPHVELTMARIAGAPQSEIARLEAASQASLAAVQAKPAEQEAVKPEVEKPVEQVEQSAEEIAAAEEAAKVATEAGVVTETPEEIAAKTEAAAEAARLEVVAKEDAQDRFRFKRDKDRAIAQLAKANDIDLAEAAKAYEKMFPVKTETVQTAPNGPAVQALTAKVAELDARIEDEAEAQSGLSSKAMRQLERERAEALADLKVAQLREEQSTAANTAIEATWQEQLSQAEKQFPDLADHDSSLYLIAAQYASAANDPNHPDHAAGQKPDAPLYFAKKAAAKLGKQPAKAQATTVIPTKPAETPKPGPVSGTRQTIAATPQKTGEALIAEKRAQTLAVIGGARGAQVEGPVMLVL